IVLAYAGDEVIDGLGMPTGGIASLSVYDLRRQRRARRGCVLRHLDCPLLFLSPIRNRVLRCCLRMKYRPILEVQLHNSDSDILASCPRFFRRTSVRFEDRILSAQSLEIPPGEPAVAGLRKKSALVDITLIQSYNNIVSFQFVACGPHVW